VNAARHRVVLATGASKAAIVERWLLGDQRLPIDRVRRASTLVILDDAAAARLPCAPPSRAASGGSRRPR
jgi:6-phosphogluconolactonase/glucosamine-6-phosphate isomerase/deaminase